MLLKLECLWTSQDIQPLGAKSSSQKGLVRVRLQGKISWGLSYINSSIYSFKNSDINNLDSGSSFEYVINSGCGEFRRLLSIWSNTGISNSANSDRILP